MCNVTHNHTTKNEYIGQLDKSFGSLYKEQVVKINNLPFITIYVSILNTEFESSLVFLSFFFSNRETFKGLCNNLNILKSVKRKI